MSIPKIILLIWFAYAALAAILSVGKQRDATTPARAATSVCLAGVIAFLVVIA